MAPFFIGLLSVLLGIISVLIVLVVLMQRPKQEGLGAAFGGGMTDQMFGAQTTNVLQKGTVYLAVMFFVFSLIISVLTAKSVRDNTDTIEELKNEKVEETPAPVDIPNGSANTPPVQVETTPVEEAKEKVEEKIDDAAEAIEEAAEEIEDAVKEATDDKPE